MRIMHSILLLVLDNKYVYEHHRYLHKLNLNSICMPNQHEPVLNMPIMHKC